MEGEIALLNADSVGIFVDWSNQRIAPSQTWFRHFTTLSEIQEARVLFLRWSMAPQDGNVLETLVRLVSATAPHTNTNREFHREMMRRAKTIGFAILLPEER